jgi:hypothetical protein
MKKKTILLETTGEVRISTWNDYYLSSKGNLTKGPSVNPVEIYRIAEIDGKKVEK